MIDFFYETNFLLEDSPEIEKWILKIVNKENFEISQINYIFCDDEYLLDLNKKYLNHNYYTDIISFDDSHEKLLGGDIFISVPRVTDNSNNLNINFIEEMRRVIIHGILHFMGYKDKTEEEQKTMRRKEDECLKLFK